MLYQNDFPYLFNSTKFAKEFGFTGTPYPEGMESPLILINGKREMSALGHKRT